MGKKNKPDSSPDRKLIVSNKKARFNYHLLESFEAGIVLTGSEIKSIRNGGITLNESFIRVDNGELFLIGAHISQYSFTNDANYDPIRPKKLLMHKKEIEKLQGRVEQKGLTLVPTKLYLKRGRAKLALALARGKDAPDKRQTIKEREGKREAERAMKNR